jgi:ABC-2 type transport system permease protein
MMRRVAWIGSARAVMRLSWARTMTPLLLCGMLALVLLPVMFALVFASRGPLSGDPVQFLVDRYDQLVCAIAVPILALLLGTTAFAAEANDGTLMYLVTTTTPRWWIALVRILFAAVGSAALSALAVWASGRIATGESDPMGVTRAFVAASALGAAAYAAGFTALALITKRALVGGLAYVLFWEGVLGTMFPALHYLSVRQWMLAIAGSLTEATSDRLVAGPSARAALIGAGVVLVMSLLIATQRLAQPRLSRIGN